MLPARNYSSSRRVSIFKFYAQLALLESRIYTELYSIRASNRSELQRLKSVGQVILLLVPLPVRIAIAIG